MILTIKLVEGKTLKDAAIEVQQLNVAMAEQLVNGPIPTNPDSETVEGFLGDCNTLPNEYGYCTIAINGYRKLILPPGIAPQTFAVVIGEPVEDGPNGEEIRGGTLI